MEAEMISCACGCGGTLSPRDSRGRPRKFLPSHWSRVQPNQIVVVNCEQCGEPIRRSKYERERVYHQFCSQKCQGLWATEHGIRRGENNGHYNTITVECSGCGAPVSKPSSLINRRNNRVYCPNCIPPKKDSKSTWADYPPEFSTSLRRVIRSRDGNVCINCGASPTAKKAHQVHHVDYDKMNNETKNLVTLCNKCHSLTNWGRDKWQVHYQRLVIERYG